MFIEVKTLMCGQHPIVVVKNISGKVRICSDVKVSLNPVFKIDKHLFPLIYLFIYLLSIYQKDGYNTKGEPVQGAIQHTTTTNTQHDIQQVHKQNKQWHYKITKI